MRKITGLMMGVFYTFHFSFCTVINVPSDQPGIQAGIDASSDGDTVLVQPGTYYEHINFNGHNITLGSMFLMTGDTSFISQTVIDGNQSGRGITFDSGEDSTATLTGFTITNGEGSGGYGGGIYINNTSPNLTYCTISQNSSYLFGGGIFISDANPDLLCLTINQNFSTFGGGIACINSNPMISKTSITNNEVMAGNCCDCGGGGIYLDNSNPTLIQVIFYDNHAGPGILPGWFSGEGGAIYCLGSDPLMINVTITNNTPTIGGGGIVGLESNPILINSIIWDNYDNIAIGSSGSLFAQYSDIQDGWGGEGNIDLNPLFVDPDNSNYHLQPDSPCIDAGDPDMDGDGITCENDPDDRDPDGTRLDMGAFYFDQSGGCPVLGDVSGDNYVDILDVVQVVNCILYSSGGCSCADLNSDGTVDVSDILLMVENILGEIGL